MSTSTMTNQHRRVGEEHAGDDDMVDVHEGSCMERSVVGLISGLTIGGIMGAIFSNWSDVPLVLRDKALPALMRTGQVMMQHGSTLGTVGLAYAAVDCGAESVRGKKDWVNGVLGGIAGGAMVGVRSGKLGLAMSSMAALAATSAVVDLSDHKLTGQGFEDSVTPVRRVFPYEQ